MEGASENISSERACRRQSFASWVILDTEATSLKRRPRITELCLLAVLRDEVMSTTRPIPRVTNKMQLCFNPESAIQPNVSGLTGLYNDVLEQLGTFKDLVSLITGFLSSLPQPVCLIAHNGHHFDFPLLLSELRKGNCQSLPDVFCADSLEAFRVLDGLPAIPEWVLEREKEEKLRKAKACDNSSTPCKANYHETGNAVVITVHPPSESAQSESRSFESKSRTESPNKRQMIGVESSTDNSASSPKHLKTDAVPTFGSQSSSISDSDLVEAYDAAVAEFNEFNSPVRVVAGSSLQAEQEYTPERDSAGTCAGFIPEPVVKKPPPSSVNIAERERVARRLFDEEPNTVNNRSVHNAVKDGAAEKNITERGHTAESTSASDGTSSQGSLSDEQIVEAVSGITSLPPYSSVAGGEPVSVTPDKNAEANQNLGSVGQQQQSSIQDQVQTACGENKNASTSLVPAETGLGDPATSAHTQISDVTSSTALPTQPVNKTPSSTQQSSSTTPKVSYKLVEIYKRQYGRYPDNAHCAEDDCLTLLKVIMRKRSEFMAFVEKHAVRFDSVEPMY